MKKIKKFSEYTETNEGFIKKLINPSIEELLEKLNKAIDFSIDKTQSARMTSITSQRYEDIMQYFHNGYKIYKIANNIYNKLDEQEDKELIINSVKEMLNKLKKYFPKGLEVVGRISVYNMRTMNDFIKNYNELASKFGANKIHTKIKT